jgi:hypothetical protein
LQHEAELCGDHDLIALGGQAPSEELFVLKGAVDFRRVEKVATEFDRLIDRGGGFDIIRNAISMAHAHATEADGGYCQSVAQSTLRYHRASSKEFVASALRPVTILLRAPHSLDNVV